MRTLLTIIFLLATLHTEAQTPNFNEWFRQKKTQRRYLIQQIAALKVYLEYLKKGYNVVHKGLTTIGDIKDGTFKLDKDYFNSLKAVSPVVRNSPKVNEILVCQESILRLFRAFMPHCREDENLSPEEISEIETVYRDILTASETSIDELTLITTAGELEMKDDERLLRLDKVHASMQEQYAFAKSFIDAVSMLSGQRSRERQQIHTMKELHAQS
ncbi:MAG TPA: hypothetical protein VK658_26570 [Chryseolinea sp.]|nr:hypothetical protein [Chryseolinea sp.]